MRATVPGSQCAVCSRWPGVFPWLVTVLFDLRTILVKLVSQAGTGFSFNHKRSRLREKLSLLHYDPIVNKKVLFVEQKKIRSL
ncbi:39S ribosomal protein L33, mitochondrial [Acomys russatus]|uniref:39S ribosomal protein L33, mitochondrial n=1 Tax=Acomys russatus TaxID=60746 RepID=UPI0021E294B7|nr:39S ribosomal protein L33, mitochondrial [Acomys russatus]